MGFVKLVRDFNWLGAEQDFMRAIDLQSSDADAYDHCGRMCAGLERYDDAVALLKRARELDPLAQRVDLVTAFLSGRRLHWMAGLEEVAALSAGDTLWKGQLWEAYALAGQETKAREILRALEERAFDPFASPYHLAFGHKGLFLLPSLHTHPRIEALLQTLSLA